ncbi:MAG: PP2C family protein-serine/threonine phosphatase [Nibricoccus sp.]
MTLKPGDTIVMFTDGVSEAMNNNDDEFGEDRLIETVLAHPDLSPKDVIERILEACDKFTDGAPQHDDTTALVISRHLARGISDPSARIYSSG